MNEIVRIAKQVPRAAWEDMRRTRHLRDFPRFMVFAVGLDFIVASIAAAASGLLSPMQIWAELAVATVGVMLLAAWWELRNG